MNSNIKSPIKFFVCVPVYNVERLLERCVESVINQGYSNFALILVDDESKDKSGEICDKYAKLDARITVIHQKNQGQIAARTAAVHQLLKQREKHPDEEAFVLFLDSDDYYQPNALAVLNERINEFGGDLFIFGWNKVAQDGAKCEAPDCTRVVTDKRELYRIVFFDVSYNSLCRKAISVNLLSEKNYQNYYRFKYGEDALQSMEYLKKSKKAVFLPDVLYNYVENPVSVSRLHDNYVNFTPEMDWMQEILRFLESESVFTETDIDDFLAVCRYEIKHEALRVACSGFPHNIKTACFKKMLASEFYISLLTDKRCKDFPLKLLTKKHFKSFVFLSQCWWSAVQIYHFFRHKKE